MRTNQSWQEALGADPTPWLLESHEPWTRYRTLLDLLDRPEGDPDVQRAHAEMLAHPQVQELARTAATWGERPLKNHNDASHPIYALATLADFGLLAGDAPKLEGLETGIEAVLAHQSSEGAFQTVVLIPKRFGGTGEGAWTWVLCDAPTLLYALLGFGLGNDPRVQRAVDHLVSMVEDNGWRCAASPELGKFRGPGRKDDPCPMVNVYALKALAQLSDHDDRTAAQAGAEMLLWHWEIQAERKPYLFGIGTDYRKLKYPYVWYNLLHATEVLSLFTHVHGDYRFRQMLGELAAQADAQGRFTASSMYRAWKGWSFANKKEPSPWLTYLGCRILKRVYGKGDG
jgi:hypothetical protein